MAINKRFRYTWHVGEVDVPFTYQMVDDQGLPRTDIASAVFILVDNSPESATYGELLIDSQACQSVAGGLLSYTPTAPEMATACRFLAQFVATLSLTGYVLPTLHFEGEIEASL